MKERNSIYSRIWPLRPESFGMLMQMFNAVMVFLTGILLARRLGPAGFGAFSFIYAWILLGCNVILAGLPPLLIREIAAYRVMDRWDLIKGIVQLAERFVMAVAALAIAFVATGFYFGVFDSDDGLLLLAGMPALLFLTLSSVREASIRGLGSVLVGQVSELVMRPGLYLVLLLLLFLGLGSPGPLTVMSAFSAACAAGLAISTFFLRDRGKPFSAVEVGYDTASWFHGFGRMSAIGWIEAINVQASVIVIGSLMAPQEVGEYRVAAQVALLMIVMIKVLMAIQGPVLSAAHSRGAVSEMQKLSTRSSILCTLFAVPFFLVSLLYSKPLLSLIFGPQYVGAAMVLQILALGQLLGSVGGTVNTLAYATRSESALLAMQITMLATNLGLSLLLVPRYGAVGAATAVAVSTITFKAGLIFWVFRQTGVLALPLQRGVVS